MNDPRCLAQEARKLIEETGVEIDPGFSREVHIELRVMDWVCLDEHKLDKAKLSSTGWIVWMSLADVWG